MRILVANKFGYLRGGLERVMFDEVRWLRDAGHQVELFTTADERNEETRFARFFPQYREIGEGSTGSLQSVAAMFWNDEARRNMAGVLEEFRPDVVHVHGIHRHLSPSILSAVRRAGVPCVMTAHDFNLICPQNLLLRSGETVCEPRSCGSVWFGACVANRCVQRSTIRSVVAAAELSYQRVRHAYDSVATIVCPSNFMARALRDGSLRPSLVVVPNAVEPGPRHASNGERMLIIGRLSAEKGVDVALDAARLAGIKLTVVGEGPQGAELRSRFPEAEFTGHVGPARLEELRAEARAVVVPSRSLENAPMSVLEAMSAGVAVIASAIGGIPEIVTDEVEALLVRPGDSRDLAASLSRLAQDAELAARLGSAGRRRAETDFAPKAHLAALIGVYESAVESSRAS